VGTTAKLDIYYHELPSRDDGVHDWFCWCEPFDTPYEKNSEKYEPGKDV
jgi:hypothetical protein